MKKAVQVLLMVITFFLLVEIFRRSGVVWFLYIWAPFQILKRLFLIYLPGEGMCESAISWLLRLILKL